MSEVKKRADALLVKFRYYDANGVNLARQISLGVVEEQIKSVDRVPVELGIHIEELHTLLLIKKELEG